MDTALFEYGYTLQAGKYLREARQVYDKLLKNYPNSQHVPNAHVAFADYYYEAGQLADAETRYQQVLKFPKASVYWYAMYKLGWIHLNLQRSRRRQALRGRAGHEEQQKQEILNRAAKDFVRARGSVRPTRLRRIQRVDQKYRSRCSIRRPLSRSGQNDKAIYITRR
jgi:tetratricopeptide (TPR) repeat protein